MYSEIDCDVNSSTGYEEKYISSALVRFKCVKRFNF